MIHQHTLRDELVFEGVGLHTGSPGRVVVRPAAIGAGLRFELDTAHFAARASHVVDTRRATVVGCGGESVSTVEHLLSALAGCGVDNATIAARGPEIPILDGSAAVFADAIECAGLAEQNAPRAIVAIDRTHVFRDGDALLAVSPYDGFRVRFVADFAAPIGTQYYDVTVDPQSYRAEIAAARTFGYLHEVEALLAAGLARGGSLENALVFAPDGPMTPLRWPNEVVRHKILDLIGDFALLGARPQCEVVSIKSGHRLHARAVAELAEIYAPVAALGA